jgi:hypothetical protein
MGALPQCTYLDIGFSQIGDAGVIAFASACASGALPQLRYFGIGGDQIGDAGITALAQAIKPVSEGGSAMASLKELVVPPGCEENPQLKAACSKRGIQLV